MIRDDITVEIIKDALDYNPDSGVFQWKHRSDMPVQWNAKFVGKVAGGLRNGYITIALYNRGRYAHRLAWIITTGEWPPFEVDHINAVKSDNRWINLRQATHRENGCNCPARKTNVSGFKGVSYCVATGRWRPRIVWLGETHYFGRYDTPEEASLVYEAVARTLHGEFANIRNI